MTDIEKLAEAAIATARELEEENERLKASLQALASLLVSEGHVAIEQIDNGLCYWVEINGRRGEAESIEEAIVQALKED